MAILWRCPLCEETTEERDELCDATLVRCSACSTGFEIAETLCVICDAPNPWVRRSTIHRQCRSCGNTQMIYSHLRSA